MAAAAAAAVAAAAAAAATHLVVAALEKLPYDDHGEIGDPKEGNHTGMPEAPQVPKEARGKDDAKDYGENHQGPLPAKPHN